jgi:hypothetical protein
MNLYVVEKLVLSNLEAHTTQFAAACRSTFYHKFFIPDHPAPIWSNFSGRILDRKE